MLIKPWLSRKKKKMRASWTYIKGNPEIWDKMLLLKVSKSWE